MHAAIHMTAVAIAWIAVSSLFTWSYQTASSCNFKLGLSSKIGTQKWTIIVCKGNTPGSNYWILPQFTRTLTMDNYTVYKVILLSWPVSSRSQVVMSHFFCISTHWGRMTHICVSKSTIIASDNGLSPSRRQTIIWTNAGILLIRPLGTNFSEI